MHPGACVLACGRALRSATLVQLPDLLPRHWVLGPGSLQRVVGNGTGCPERQLAAGPVRPPSEWRPGVSAVELRFLPFPPCSLWEEITTHSPLLRVHISWGAWLAQSGPQGRELSPALSVEMI